MAKDKQNNEDLNKINKMFDSNILKNKSNIPNKLSVLPLRDIIIFPNMIFPILIGRPNSLRAVSEALERDKYIFVTAQKNSLQETLDITDLYSYGTVAKIIQFVRLQNNLLKVLVEGLFQAKIVRKLKNDSFLEANIKIINQDYDENSKKLQALIRRSTELFTSYVKSVKNMPPEIITAFNGIENPLQKLYYGAANIRSKIENKQVILNETNIEKQYFKLNTLFASEIELAKFENEIDNKIHDTMQKNQRKFFIQEQIRALQNELGDEDGNPDIAKVNKLFENVNLPKSVKQKVDEEIDKLKITNPMSPDYAVIRSYLEMLANLPWDYKTQDNFDIENAKNILDADHYDLEKPKERILEFIAILNLSGQTKKQILCFVGPPGVGKTSLAKSVARALGRNFVRFSLGGIRDEAEIRGHRKTYVGAMPGRIIQSMRKAGSINPVILLDEIDKMAMDFRGDPASALLEVLDPEQNLAFSDHYLEVDYDLSNVMFITTANVKHDIPLPLQDRMEIIELTSYLENDKINIATRHIIPKLLEEFGMNKLNITFTVEALKKIIREHTREAGVRNLERKIASILRKLAKDIVVKYGNKYSIEGSSILDNPEFIKKINNKSFIINEKTVFKHLKTAIFKDKKEQLDDKVGVVTGLAWTSVGGEILPVEATIMPGTEKLTLTGQLGEVMKESAMAALSFIRSNWNKLGLIEDFITKREIHIHVPEGAIPKDGPSAGITMTIALISAATGKPVFGNLAMTGEINLRGEVLAIGGLKEKILAAKRIGITKILIPFDNISDIEDMSEEIKSDLTIIPIKNAFEAIPYCFKDK